MMDKTKIIKADKVEETSANLSRTLSEIGEATDSLETLDSLLDTASVKVSRYKQSAKKVKQKMMNLSAEL
jgi:hypothetical protein